LCCGLAAANDIFFFFVFLTPFFFEPTFVKTLSAFYLVTHFLIHFSFLPLLTFMANIFFIPY